ncbi:hypothetical protein KL86CLO1_11826 [uncultured Eubacteriales bacterium]|uniref:Uncharacterized protein n=1 Tax=uncultured Eubacteriales bacterium TaxID=172733 RepID=A0A212JWX7_9FIRM|nr:hypothetical protein KL86CLO1_11826 [uncultured Eubacteriales bacterium]
MKGEVSNCFVLGTSRFAPANGISYATWPYGRDMLNATMRKRAGFRRLAAVNFKEIWDKRGTSPYLKPAKGRPTGRPGLLGAIRYDKN